MKQHFERDEYPGSLSLVCEFMAMTIYELIKGSSLGRNRIVWGSHQLLQGEQRPWPRNGIFQSDGQQENIIIKPLFLGYNELDPISKIHEVMSTPGSKTPNLQALA
ncbi:MAPK/MAK/MRK overlapping kinase isoform X2 [Agelaius tricolor]|uniref:MAPK/MAK/MRK overlapping kinase isoform X2 n=1 Tax=Agelaius tricolor TaxID=9191 RepID=UPI0039F210A4